jgi:glutamate-1-semialdehyde 2,1-aminomutase
VNAAPAAGRSASAALARRAAAVLPGGNTRTTVFMQPQVYARAGAGCLIEDADGNQLLDFVNNYTALIHGHARAEIVAAATAEIARGTCFSLPTAAEVALAELITARVASIERIRFTNSGTEAVMMAIKAARAFTGRWKIAKAEGAYHGSYDAVEVSEDSTPDRWGAGDAPAAIPYSAGISPRAVAETVVIPFNDVGATEAIVRRHAGELAALVVDPIAPRIGLIPATAEWLAALRRLADAHGIVLISDEIITFRIAHGGVQAAFGFRADLTALGKIIGGGFPVGAVGGRADIMAVFDPTGGKPRVPHGGTFNANPVTMVAGRAAMELLDAAAFARLAALGERAASGIAGAFATAGRPAQVTGHGSLRRIHLTDRPLRDYRSAYPSPEMKSAMTALVAGLLDRGVHIAPSGLIAMSTAMSEEHVDRLVAAVAAVVGGS